MHRTPLNLQYYIPRTTERVFAPPFAMRGIDTVVLVMEAKPGVLQELIDRELNTPWRQAFARRGLRHQYEPETDWFLVSISDVAKLSPERPGEGPLITARQRELIVMVPTVDRATNLDGDVKRRFWYPPVVLNDLPPAVLAGRELFGFPKVHATFEFDGASTSPEKPLLEADGSIGWHRLVIKTYLPPKRSPVPHSSAALPSSGPQEEQLDLRDLVALKVDDVGQVQDELDGLAQEVKQKLEPRVEFLFIRQFRDPQFIDYASYQAAVSATARPSEDGDSSGFKAVPRPENARFEPLWEHPYSSDVFTALMAGSMQPRAVLTSKNGSLVVTRGSIEWDKP